MPRSIREATNIVNWVKSLIVPVTATILWYGGWIVYANWKSRRGSTTREEGLVFFGGVAVLFLVFGISIVAAH